jgi:DNA/RNA-binding domain of Phe-tRNA-synthetase-like protein
MKFYVTQDVFDVIPNAQFGLVSVYGVDNSKEYKQIEDGLTEAIGSCEEHFEGKKVKEEAELLPYRDAFRNIGINPNKFMSSIEALLTRIAKKKGMPYINPIVDLGNEVSLFHYVPIGAHDLDTMTDDAFCVRTATAEDTFLPFGAEERELVDEGEVVYATGNKIRTRRWIWRQSEEGKITEDTKDLLFIMDGFDENLDEIMAAREQIADLLENVFGCKVKKGLINKDSMEYICDTEA